jgi:hypothetical protein
MEETRYSVGRRGLEKLSREVDPHPSRVVRWIAHIVSIVFHPLFIPTYVVYFLLFVHPLVAAGYSYEMKFFRLVLVIFCTLFIPALSVFIMWRLQLVVTSIQLKTQKERLIPYVIAMIMYFWCWYVCKNRDSPIEMQLFLLGAFLSVCAAWLLNIPMRVSMHSTAVGTVLAFFMLLAFRDPAFNGVYLSIVIFITGLVCTARLMVSHHTNKEIYAGLFAGIVCQLIATFFV